ncbi:MAG: methylmalonyl-CoA mutase family protein, partial [Pseudomonadota bacterium]|nr:methylmalonyl-CoA mutase family protein [Pseudomonadota bacterium]
MSALLLDFSATKSISADELDALLAGVMLDIAPVVLAPAACGVDGILAFLDLLARRHEHVETISGHLNFDPFAMALAANQPVSPQGLEALVARAADLPRLGLMLASGAAFHNEGAAPTDELAYMLAALTQSLRLLEAHGLAPEDALPRINLMLSADTDFFMTIAKIRSARQLFHMVAKNIGCAHVAPTIHCETSQRAYSRLDPWVNILRATVSTLAAGIGGAELISVAPCSATSDSDNTLTRRIARNTQIILQEESHIAHVSDAAGGSWYVEALTQQLTEQAWAMFRSIEAAGGLTEQINDGSVRAQLDARCRDYEALVETRDLPLVGVSEFPNLDESPLPAPATAQSGYRHADKFEALRDIAERAKPKVYLACLGEAAAFTPRANFAANTYATGGMHAITGAGGSNIAAIVQEFADSDAKIAVICGTDDDYEE